MWIGNLKWLPPSDKVYHMTIQGAMSVFIL